MLSKKKGKLSPGKSTAKRKIQLSTGKIQNFIGTIKCLRKKQIAAYVEK